MDLWRYLIIYENGGIYLDADGFFENCLDISMYNKYDHIFIYDPGYKNIHNGFFILKMLNIMYIKK
jgi:mannosyltransferase OCH1-like enzyme